MNGAERAAHRAMIASPARWPLFPLLPLIRTGPAGTLDLGVLVHRIGRNDPLTVVRGNLLLLPRSQEALRSLPSERFSSIDALLEAGWRVD